jgi:threonine aldolase
VTRDRRTADRELGRQLTRAPLALGEELHDATPRRIGQCLERLHVHKVTHLLHNRQVTERRLHSLRQNDDVIDLRSDTATRPTPEMRAAIAAAVVGDEQRREDPTVLELERRGAELLGQEEAVFLPTATMANQIALRILSRPGHELLAEEHSHVLLYEEGGPAVHSGLVTRGLPGRGGRITPQQVRGAVRGPSVVSLENTHNSSGGRFWRLDELEAVVATCRELELPVHLDGARLLNAAVASGVSPAALGRPFDTVTVCFSKALGCPLGALVAGSLELMARARQGKFLFGGAMRQAGIIAAGALYALDHHVERLAEDHARARRLAEGLHAAGVPVEPEQVETNFVQIDVAALGLSRAEALERLRAEGVGLSSTIHPTVIRAVTHLDVSEDQISEAIEAIPRAIGALARV